MKIRRITGKDKAKGILLPKIIVLLVLCVFNSIAKAELIEIYIEATITNFDDRSNQLEGRIQTGDIISGIYRYDSDTPDDYPLDPTGAIYSYTAQPYGIHLQAGGFDFMTDPQNVSFIIGINNNFGGTITYDDYGIGSINNLPLSNGVQITDFRWQLEDNTSTAITSDALPLKAPDLTRWGQNRLYIEGGPRIYQFYFDGPVTKAVLIPEPATFMLLALGGILLKRKAK